MTRVGHWILALLLLALAPAAAAAGGIVLESADPVDVRAEVDVLFPEGAAHVWINDARGSFDLRGATGRVTVQAWNVTRASIGQLPDGRVETIEHDVANATLRFVWDGVEIRSNMLAQPGGHVIVRGRVDAAGHPSYLEEDVVAQIMLPVSVPLEGRYVPFELSAGDAFVGFHASPAPHVGFPFEREGRIDLRGPVTFQMDGGTVAFDDPQGGRVEYRLGPEEPAGATPAVTRYRRLIFEGDAAGSDMPASDRWIAGGPESIWDADGTLRWTNATGTYTTAEGAQPFERVPVEVAGLTTLTNARDGVAPLAATRYDARGEWSRVAIGNAAAATGGIPPVAQAVGLGALLAILLGALTDWGQGLLGRVAAALYTRIVPNRILDHPQRAKIREIVGAEPGIHLAELHRRLGGAWGPFTFHLRMLEKMDVVRVHKEGKYRSLYLDGHAPAHGQVHSPTARQILEALGAEGASASIPQVSAATGISRQLVRYHLLALREQGKVEQTDARTWTRLAAGPRDEA